MELALRESPEGAIEVPGLREVEVCSLEDCLGLLQLGDRNRCESSSAYGRNCSPYCRSGCQRLI